MRIIFLVLIVLSGCQRAPVITRLEPLKSSYLASSKVGTPDPMQTCFCGEQLVVSWDLPARCFSRLSPMFLHLSYVTGEHKLQAFSMPIYERSGYYVHRLIGSDYTRTKGILIYKADLVSARGKLLFTSRHRSWVEWIAVEEDEECQVLDEQTK